LFSFLDFLSGEEEREKLRDIFLGFVRFCEDVESLLMKYGYVVESKSIKKLEADDFYVCTFVFYSPDIRAKILRLLKDADPLLAREVARISSRMYLDLILNVNISEMLERVREKERVRRISLRDLKILIEVASLSEEYFEAQKRGDMKRMKEIDKRMDRLIFRVLDLFEKLGATLRLKMRGILQGFAREPVSISVPIGTVEVVRRYEDEASVYSVVVHVYVLEELVSTRKFREVLHALEETIRKLKALQ